MSNLFSRLFAFLLLIWLPLSFFLPPALVLLAIYLFQHGCWYNRHIDHDEPSLTAVRIQDHRPLPL